MLGAQRCVDVDDGSCVYLDPAAHVVWPDAVVIMNAAKRLRTVYHDQQRVLRAADADALVAAGLARRVGGRIFEQPGLSTSVFDWDATAEIDFVERALGDDARAATGVEFGVGAGRILLALLDRGWRLDGVDAAEPTVRWLADVLAARADEAARTCRLTVADLSACAFPGAYGWAVAGLNTLRYLPSVASLRRHLHLAAVSVRAGGRYVVHVDSWTVGAPRVPDGDAGEWTTPDGLRVVWTKVRSDPAACVDLERVEVFRDGDVVLDEHQTQLALPIERWHELVAERGEWRVVSAHLDGDPEPVEITAASDPVAGNVWLVLERTDVTGEAIFSR